MAAQQGNGINESISAIRMPSSTADLGEEPRLLTPDLAAQYVVESDYEDDIVSLIGAAPKRHELLARLGPSLRSSFGGDARLMLARTWRLSEPVGPMLNLVIYTWLGEPEAADALRQLRMLWSEDVAGAGLTMSVIRMFRTAPGA